MVCSVYIYLTFTGRNQGRRYSRTKSTSGSTSSYSSISTNHLRNIVEKLKCEQIRDSTRKNYYSIWRQFSEFFLQLDHKPTEWEDRISLFVGYLIERKKQSQTIRSYISALKSVSAEDNITINTDSFLLSALVRACKFKNDVAHTRLPIRKPVLQMVIQESLNHFSNIGQPFLANLYAALISTAYFGLFRIGELTFGSHPVKVTDVHLACNKRKFLFVLRTSKTHGLDSRPQSIKITSNKKLSSEDSTLCPYNILHKYITI